MGALARLIVSILIGTKVRRHSKAKRKAQRGAQRVMTYRAAVIYVAERAHVGYPNRTSFRRAMSIDTIYRRDHGRCALCRGKVERYRTDKWGPQRDHIVPLSKGGAHAPENIQLVHAICNQRKGDKWP